MRKLLLALISICVGVAGFREMRWKSERSLQVASAEARQWEVATNQLAEEQAQTAALRQKVQEKRNQLGPVEVLPAISPEMLKLLEGQSSGFSAAAWAQLRQQLGIDWNSSPDYVLVSKEAARRVDYDRLRGVQQTNREASEIACDVLALSPDEQVALRTFLQRFSEHSRQPLQVERAEPGGDIVAQYKVAGPDPGVMQSFCSNFTAEIVGMVGQQRADLLLPEAWRQVQSDLSYVRAGETQTMTIRQTVVDDGPDLICEMKNGGSSFSIPVRYANYPSGWFLTMFPGGWKTLADREGFELPPHFQK